jgi:hypothetical protein
VHLANDGAGGAAITYSTSVYGVSGDLAAGHTQHLRQ